SLKGRKLADDTRILCASPDYLARHGTPQRPEELTGHQVIAFQDAAPKQLLSGAGQTGLFDPRQAGCRLVVDDGLSLKIATATGAGISSNSLWSVHAELCSGALVRVLPDYEVDDRSVLWLVYPKSNVLTAKVRTFIDFLLEKIGKAPAWETQPATN
ncbi:MAG: substrate binding domain-containing protein, partial [Pseudomonadota bacterium]